MTRRGAPVGRLIWPALAVLLPVTAFGCLPATDEEPTADGAAVPIAPVDGPRLDRETALALAALPLACLDRPHPAPTGTGYLHEQSPSLLPDFERRRAFYGCYDWHSAVNSTWTLVALMRRVPGLPVEPLIVEKLRQHLSGSALQGEAEFFEANPGFERPYGWAWYLLLHADLTRLEHPEAAAWVERTAPLAERFANGLAEYLERLDYPLRAGTHASTAFALDLAIEFADVTGRPALGDALRGHARRFFVADRDCPLAYEPSASDFLSPCLQEAVTMAAALPDEELEEWLTGFLPGPGDEAFRRLRAPLRIAASDEELDVAEQGARSHLIGLAFTRAEALSRLAATFDPGHPTAAAYRETAAELAAWGMESMFAADYLGSHWIGTFATRYLLTLPTVAPAPE